ncbi:MAG: sulfite exporter TauE/SafE family protein [Nanoarchaeota archaeon]|nr:sulfite exporter TauE/SafE family protein [Nanoarchaeota archaeon]
MEEIIKKEFIAKGTVCDGCTKIIKKQMLEVKGVKEVEFDYATETGFVKFDKNKTDIDEILDKIEEKGYECYILGEEKLKNNKTLGLIFGIIGIIVIAYFVFRFVDGISFPQISQNMGYGLLFLVGLLTGFHCISMCGGFVVSYTTKNAQDGVKSHKSHLMYGLGKIISYTVIGAIFGLIGSIIAFTPTMRGVAGLLAGLFLVFFGLKMLNIFPILRKIQFKTPKFLTKITGKSQKNSSPLVIGLLNGFMIACGPLQAIYIMAAGTGSLVEGAKLLFIFALGTLPVMLGFGFFTSYMSKKLTHKILKASGAIVIILGLVMINNGLVLTGTGYDFKSMVESVSGTNNLAGNVVDTTINAEGYQEIKMEVDRYGWTPDKFVLKKDVPVKWIINGKEINGCNNAIQVPKLGLKFDIKKGEQIIEFTPTEEGVISWSCWMGMIPGTFIVKEDVDLNNNEEIQQELDAIPKQQGGSCGGSGGGCGCGG